MNISAPQSVCDATYTKLATSTAGASHIHGRPARRSDSTGRHHPSNVTAMAATRPATPMVRTICVWIVSTEAARSAWAWLANNVGICRTTTYRANTPRARARLGRTRGSGPAR